MTVQHNTSRTTVIIQCTFFFQLVKQGQCIISQNCFTCRICIYDIFQCSITFKGKRMINALEDDIEFAHQTNYHYVPHRKQFKKLVHEVVLNLKKYLVLASKHFENIFLVRQM